MPDPSPSSDQTRHQLPADRTHPVRGPAQGGCTGRGPRREQPPHPRAGPRRSTRRRPADPPRGTRPAHHPGGPDPRHGPGRRHRGRHGGEPIPGHHLPCHRNHLPARLRHCRRARRRGRRPRARPRDVLVVPAAPPPPPLCALPASRGRRRGARGPCRLQRTDLRRHRGRPDHGRRPRRPGGPGPPHPPEPRCPPRRGCTATSSSPGSAITAADRSQCAGTPGLSPDTRTAPCTPTIRPPRTPSTAYPTPGCAAHHEPGPATADRATGHAARRSCGDLAPVPTRHMLPCIAPRPRRHAP